MAVLMADGRSRFTAVSRFKDAAITDDRKKIRADRAFIV